MNFSVDIIKKDIIDLSSKDFMIKYLLKSDVWYFSEYQKMEFGQAIEQMEGLKEIINSKLGIAYHNVLMVGSGKIGCSLNPNKNFKHFNDDSDIDIAIISLNLFNDIWLSIRKICLNEIISDYQGIASSVFRGFINEKQFSNIDFARQYWNSQIKDLNRCIQEELSIYHPVNYRIYRSWEDLEDYHIKGINTIKRSYKQNGNYL